MPDKVLNPERQQFSRPVETTPVINGATCLVSIDVDAIRSTLSVNWQLDFRKNPALPPLTDDRLEAELLRQILDGLAGCPAGSRAKLQLRYHCDPKPVAAPPVPPGRFTTWRDWSEPVAVAHVLRQNAALLDGKVQKVYLSSCYSQEYLDPVDAAFSIPSVEYVVTCDDIVNLIPGKMSGSEYPNIGKPAPLGVIVWSREGGKQIAHVPTTRVGADEEYDLYSGRIMHRACGVPRDISGDSRVVVGFYDTAAGAMAAASAMVQAMAEVEAGLKMSKLGCPATCPRGVLGPVTVSNLTVDTRTTLLQLIASLFWARWKYEGVARFSWAAQYTCTRP